MVTIPKWVWNTETESITKEEIFYQFKNFKEKDGYEGVMIVLWNSDGYMSDKYFEKYSFTLESAKELGMKIIIWDENGFPSGPAGGLLEEKHPEACAKRLDLEEFILTKNQNFKYKPSGNCQGTVLYDCDSNEINVLSGDIDVTPVKDNMKIMVFSCVTANDMNAFGHRRKLVDYLDSESVGKFIGLTHEAYYKRFKKFFGDTICMAFYDEPAFWHIEGGRIWTAKFAAKFEKKYGFSPVALYPALWYDIGKDTAFARKILFGFRAELYSEEYIHTLADWCENHGIQLTGHQDQEEIINPTSICGDLMKVFKHQHIPGVDEIAYYGRGSKAYKLISSAADNYGKDLIMCEVFGAMGEDMDVQLFMREALDMLAKGINFFVPHGTWYDNNPEKIIYPPELSFRSRKFAEPVAAFNRFVKECCEKLQGSEHICEAAVLYPIDDLQANTDFQAPDAYQGAVNPGWSDYLDFGEKLSYEYYRDFIFIHPEILEIWDLSNFKVIIVPGMKYISIKTLEKLKCFRENGGIVLSTGLIPTLAVEQNKDERVAELTETIFRRGETLNDADFTVKIKCDGTPQNGHLSYIQKRKDGKDFLFIANSSDTQLHVNIKIKNKEERQITLEPVEGTFLFFQDWLNK